ncbi:hypothetical protein J6590_033224 [Homalodisca vitripennis]|nr:hypothetical protein J6590_033224 [Homalodisca vitripennis]
MPPYAHHSKCMFVSWQKHERRDDRMLYNATIRAPQNTNKETAGCYTMPPYAHHSKCLFVSWQKHERRDDRMLYNATIRARKNTNGETTACYTMPSYARPSKCLFGASIQHHCCQDRRQATAFHFYQSKRKWGGRQAMPGADERHDLFTIAIAIARCDLGSHSGKGATDLAAGLPLKTFPYPVAVIILQRSDVTRFHHSSMSQRQIYPSQNSLPPLFH